METKINQSPQSPNQQHYFESVFWQVTYAYYKPEGMFEVVLPETYIPQSSAISPPCFMDENV